MKTFALTAMIWLIPSSVLAGHNCKCQDPSGTGPQWDDYTQQVCGYLNSRFCTTYYHGDQHHQCSTPNNCLDSGHFNDLCASYPGVPGAFCWD